MDKILNAQFLLYSMDITPLLNEPLYSRFLHLVPPYRQEKIQRFRLAKDRALSLGAGLLLGYALKQAGFWEKGLSLVLGAQEKPGFPEIADRFQFNLSHSGSQVLCGAYFSPVGHALSLGCDIEVVEKANLTLARRFFSDDEQAWLSALPQGAKQDSGFYRLWTLKESFLKATGTGLSRELSSFSVIPQEDGSIVFSGSASEERFAFGESDAFPGYRAAWCVAGKPVPPVWMTVTLDDMI